MTKTFRYHILVKQGSKKLDEAVADNVLLARNKLIDMIHKTVLCSDVSFSILVKEYENE